MLSYTSTLYPVSSVLSPFKQDFCIHYAQLRGKETFASFNDQFLKLKQLFFLGEAINSCMEMTGNGNYIGKQQS
ncbi:hypothetical protein Y1Q_0001240 [Alligator mississippiensis]|uniref:Uncharacterized protein n=1 Tax=Alligator mississippiensis TaxID=8496 RepID=A0A151PE95_ALLMI|nr:hypothetical protein Y1Q_0001240 [Alligator mississippiensis]